MSSTDTLIHFTQSCVIVILSCIIDCPNLMISRNEDVTALYVRIPQYDRMSNWDKWFVILAVCAVNH